VRDDGIDEGTRARRKEFGEEAARLRAVREKA
jgi:hypothetical protein